MSLSDIHLYSWIGFLLVASSWEAGMVAWLVWTCLWFLLGLIKLFQP